MLYKDLKPGALFQLGEFARAWPQVTRVHYTDENGDRQLCTIENEGNRLLWYKLDDGRAVMMTTGIRTQFNTGNPDGQNANERRHGSPAYLESYVKTYLEGYFLSCFSLFERNQMETMECETDTPKGYTRKYGPKQRWKTVITLPSIHDYDTDAKEFQPGSLKDAKNAIYAYDKYSPWMTCDAHGPWLWLLECVGPTDAMKIDRMFDIHPIIRPKDDANLEAETSYLWSMEPKVPELCGNLIDILRSEALD